VVASSRISPAATNCLRNEKLAAVSALRVRGDWRICRAYSIDTGTTKRRHAAATAIRLP
jgi:hypothetical protein